MNDILIQLSFGLLFAAILASLWRVTNTFIDRIQAKTQQEQLLAEAMREDMAERREKNRILKAKADQTREHADKAPCPRSPPALSRDATRHPGHHGLSS